MGEKKFFQQMVLEQLGIDRHKRKGGGGRGIGGGVVAA